MKKKYTPEEATKAKSEIDAMVAKGMSRGTAGRMKGHITRRTKGHETAFAKIERQHAKERAARVKALQASRMALRIEVLLLKAEQDALILGAIDQGVTVSRLAAVLEVDEREIRRRIKFVLEAKR
ncbi:hypothetical protein K3172_15375 [Qipengyuania sp. 6B39]|uniref:hypothetical protein n=1 Tax=Qipengyuania proteolytica TaxID=2867239 RepID=UPI001C8AEA9C|nr:hypothetical protein [Qipengyuania proteolytica]MBX7497240.1 hypothetical protein [Qipengyuania proteolytica]